MSDTLSVRDAMELLAVQYEKSYWTGTAKCLRYERYVPYGQEVLWIRAIQAAYALGVASGKTPSAGPTDITKADWEAIWEAAAKAAEDILQTRGLTPCLQPMDDHPIQE